MAIPLQNKNKTGLKDMPMPLLMPLWKAVSIVEKDLIITTLAFTKGNKSKTASMLQVDIKTLRSKIKQYDIKFNME